MEENLTHEPLSMDKFEVTINVPGKLKPVAESFEEKHGETFSDMFEIEDVDETTTNMIIKKPVDEMTDDEKSCVRDVLTECFGATDELLNKINL